MSFPFLTQRASLSWKLKQLHHCLTLSSCNVLPITTCASVLLIQDVARKKSENSFYNVVASHWPHCYRILLLKVCSEPGAMTGRMLEEFFGVKRFLCVKWIHCEIYPNGLILLLRGRWSPNKLLALFYHGNRLSVGICWPARKGPNRNGTHSVISLQQQRLEKGLAGKFERIKNETRNIFNRKQFKCPKTISLKNIVKVLDYVVEIMTGNVWKMR